MDIVKKWHKRAAIFSFVTALVLPVVTPATNDVQAASPQTTKQSIIFNQEKMIKDINAAAKIGKTIDSEEFRIGSSIKDIYKKWGNPPTYGEDGAGYVELSYGEPPVTFWARQNKVEIIDSWQENYHKIIYQQVKKILGKPVSEKHVFHGETGYFLVTYKAGTYTLEFYFNHQRKSDYAYPTDKLEYVSVYKTK